VKPPKFCLTSAKAAKLVQEDVAQEESRNFHQSFTEYAPFQQHVDLQQTRNKPKQIMEPPKFGLISQSIV
jgi:hypothetical protein